MADFDSVVLQGRPEVRRDPIMKWITRKALVMGTSGVGKTTIVNMLFNNGYGVDECSTPGKVANDAGAVTLNADVVLAPKHGLLLCDSRGLSDPKMSDKDVFLQARSIFKTLEEGPTVLIVVARFGRWTKESLDDVSMFDKMFKKKWRKQSILVLTHYDGDNESDALQKWYAKAPDVQEVVGRFASVILTENSIAPLFEEVTRPRREKCLKDLKECIEKWSEPINFGINSFSDLIRVLFQHLRRACLDDEKRTDLAFRNFETEHGSSTNLGLCSLCPERSQITAADAEFTKCGHVFHHDCIFGWLEKQFRQVPDNPPCPNCDKPVTGFSFKN